MSRFRYRGQTKCIVNVVHLTWLMLSWHWETELTPGSSTRSFIFLTESLLSEHTVIWCLGCSGWTNSVLEITSIKPALALSLTSCPWSSCTLDSSPASPVRKEQICWNNDWAVERSLQNKISFKILARVINDKINTDTDTNLIEESDLETGKNIFLNYFSG